MSNTKYELVKTDRADGLFRIRALKTFGNVMEGDVGGYVQSERNLSEVGDCWIYGDAMVYGNALVAGNARVFHDARVFDDATVYGDASVSGDTRVYGKAQVCDHAQIYDKAHVYGRAQIYDKARIHGCSRVSGTAKVYGTAWVAGEAEVLGTAEVLSDAYAEGCTQVTGGHHIGSINDKFDSVVYIQCSRRVMTIYKDLDGVQRCNIGCQNGMSLEQLEQRIANDGGMRPHRQQYIDLMKQIIL